MCVSPTCCTFCDDSVLGAGFRADSARHGFRYPDDARMGGTQDWREMILDRLERLDLRFDGVHGQISGVGGDVHRLDLHVEQLEVHLVGLDARVDGVEAHLKRVEARLEHVEARLEHVEARLEHVEARLDRVEARLDRIDERLERVERRLDRGEERLERVEARLDTVEQQLIETRDEMRALHETAMSAIAQLGENVEALRQQMERGFQRVEQLFEQDRRFWSALLGEHEVRLRRLETHAGLPS